MGLPQHIWEGGLLYSFLIVAVWMKRSLIACCSDEASTAAPGNVSLTAKIIESDSHRLRTQDVTPEASDNVTKHPRFRGPSPAQWLLTQISSGKLRARERNSAKKTALEQAARTYGNLGVLKRRFKVITALEKKLAGEADVAPEAEGTGTEPTTTDELTLLLTALNLLESSPKEDSPSQSVVHSIQKMLQALDQDWFAATKHEENRNNNVEGTSSNGLHGSPEAGEKLPPACVLTRSQSSLSSPTALRATEHLSYARNCLKQRLEWFLERRGARLALPSESETTGSPAQGERHRGDETPSTTEA